MLFVIRLHSEYLEEAKSRDKHEFIVSKMQMK